MHYLSCTSILFLYPFPTSLSSSFLFFPFSFVPFCSQPLAPTLSSFFSFPVLWNVWVFASSILPQKPLPKKPCLCSCTLCGKFNNDIICKAFIMNYINLSILSCLLSSKNDICWFQPQNLLSVSVLFHCNLNAFAIWAGWWITQPI